MIPRVPVSGAAILMLLLKFRPLAGIFPASPAAAASTRIVSFQPAGALALEPLHASRPENVST